MIIRKFNYPQQVFCDLAAQLMQYYVFCNCAVEGKMLTVAGVHIYLHCMGLLGMLEMDDTEEQGILGTVK